MYDPFSLISAGGARFRDSLTQVAAARERAGLFDCRNRGIVPIFTAHDRDKKTGALV